ncbi:uncharacterized protein [Miscanthus floridulus]|uniref:uncharacterized protein n=1 Tax=Miscanthus floridulus TaxID=154761 RepID=UPI0034579AE2
MQFSGVVTIPGIYNVSSNLGQNHLQIAAGVSPDYQRVKPNNTLHHISQILIEDIDERVERVGSHEGEAALHAAEKAFHGILEQVYPPSLEWSPLHHSGEADGPGEGSNSYHKRPRRSSFTTDISSHSMLQSLPAPLSPYRYSRSLFLPYQPLASTGMASRFGFPALQIRREAKDAKGFDKMVIHLDGDKLSICRLTTATAKKVPGKSKYAIFPYIQTWIPGKGGVKIKPSLAK